MKFVWKRMATLALALLMLLGCFAFVACNNEPVDPDPTPGNDPVNPGNTPEDPDKTPEDPEAPTEPDATDYLMTIPKQNYGKTFTMLTDVGDLRRTELYFANEEEALGDTMDTAIFYRNNRVEEHLGIDFENVTAEGGWQTRGDYINRIYASYSTGDQDFQMASCYMAFAADGAVAGYYYDVNSIDAIDLSSPWYVQSWFDNTLINDQCYLILGDLSLTMWKNLNAIYFNKQVSRELGLTDTLYQKAADGEWTMELLMDCAQLSSYEDGNDVWDTSDTYGLYLTRFNTRAMVTYFDIPLTRMSDSGEYELCLYNERTETIYGTLHSYIWNNDCVYKNTGNDGDIETGKAMFTEDRLLFFPTYLQVSQDLREMDGDFGILPMPKLDDEQENYHSHSYDNFSVFLIPGHINDAEFAGTVVDALNAESKYSVIPTYYDVVLKGRTTKDEQSVAMLDIIRDHLTFDFSFAHLAALDNMWTKFGQNLLVEANSSFKPQYDKDAEKWQSLLTGVMDSYWDVR